jgi:hypothetical protein
MNTQQYYYAIHNRGVDTIAVWTVHLPAFVVGELTLASHSADVNSFNARALEVSQTGTALGQARAGRDAIAGTLKGVCSRALSLILGSLPPGHSLIREARRIYRLRGQSLERVNRRCLDLVSVWQSVNAHRAAQSPVQPGLTVDAMDVAAFQSAVANFAQLITDAATKETQWTQKKSALRDVAQRVDRNNKRWYKAWQGQFARGTAARDALNLIDTGPSQSQPGQGVFLAVEVLANQTVKLSFDAARATTFTLRHKGPADTEFTELASGVTENSFTHESVAAGGHTYIVTPGNSAGTGEDSLPFIVTVAQQAAA